MELGLVLGSLDGDVLGLTLGPALGLIDGDTLGS